jgi:hypothetical protein
VGAVDDFDPAADAGTNSRSFEFANAGESSYRMHISSSWQLKASCTSAHILPHTMYALVHRYYRILCVSPYNCPHTPLLFEFANAGEAMCTHTTAYYVFVSPYNCPHALLLFELAYAGEEGEGNDDEDPPHAHARRAASTNVGAVRGGDLMKSREIGAPE